MGTSVRAIGILVALALVLTSAQCVVACALASCQTRNDVPPCHRHQPVHTHKLPLTCSHELTIVRIAYLEPQVSDSDFATTVLAMTAVPCAANVAAVDVAGQNSSPPGLTPLSGLVLRI